MSVDGRDDASGRPLSILLLVDGSLSRTCRGSTTHSKLEGDFLDPGKAATPGKLIHS